MLRYLGEEVRYSPFCLLESLAGHLAGVKAAYFVL